MQKKPMFSKHNTLPILVLALVLQSCGSSKTLEVAALPVVTPEQELALISYNKKQPDKTLLLGTREIRDFDYQVGNSYSLKVKKQGNEVVLEEVLASRKEYQAEIPRGSLLHIIAINEEVLPKDIQMYISFEMNATFHGMSGCNRFSGSYNQVNADLQIGENIRQTKKMCDPATNAWENKLIQLLPQLTGMRRIDDSLILLSESGDKIWLSISKSERKSK